MKQLAALSIPVILSLVLTGCTTPGPTSEQQTPGTEIRSEDRGIDRLLIEASRSAPPRSTSLRIQATALAMEKSDLDLATRIVRSIEAPYETADTTREYTFVVARLALLNDDPRAAIKALDDPRFQRLPLENQTQITTGRLRAAAYKMGRSYLASGRELIYVSQLIPDDERAATHDEIFQTLLMLPEQTLETQAEMSITSEIRGWLSLAAMTKRFQRDPLRQLNALADWRRLWPNHPAAILMPQSLDMLSRIVAERPQRIAMILPLKGELGNFGRAIRDGFLTAHFELTPGSSLHFYDSTQADIRELVSEAVADGAELIIGPLDRAKVTQLASQSLPVPVIALNRTLGGEINPDLYQFGLAPEDESTQVAEQILREGKTKGLVVAPDSDWGDRNFNAFAARFIEQGGVIVDNARFTEQRDYSDMVKRLLNVDSSEQRMASLQRMTGERFEFNARRRQDIDFVFLLSNASQARGIKPTLAFFYAEDVPVYATSHVHIASTSRIDSIDLNGVRFCDIPWKLTNNDPTQKLITQTWDAAATNLAPFYALGVDVHRLYPRLQQLKEFPTERVFGSTGILTLNSDNIVTRSLMWAQFRDGEVVAVPMIFETL